MPKASEVAANLRRLAAALESEPETIVTRPLCFFYPDDKQELSTITRLLPRPLAKFAEGEGEYDNIGVEVGSGSEEAVWVRASINRSKTCERVQTGTKIVPSCVLSAREETVIPERVVPIYAWHCPPILAPEEASVGA
jgi:hypothetical protein